VAIGAVLVVVVAASIEAAAPAPKLVPGRGAPAREWRPPLDLGELRLDASLADRFERIERTLSVDLQPTAGPSGASLLPPPAAAPDGERPGDEAPRPTGPRLPRGPNLFELDVGGARSAFSHGDGRNEAAVAIGDRIVAHPTYLRPGRASDLVLPGQWSEVAARALLDGDRATGLSLHVHAVLWGRYFRRYERRGPAEIAGSGLLVGLGPSLDYDSRVLPDVRDRTVSTGVFGPMVELDRRHGKAGLRATASAHYSLAVVQSLAQPGGADTPGDALPPPAAGPALRGEGGYYAHGLVSRAALALRWQRLELALAGRLDAFWSLDGRDRLQMQPAGDFGLSDQRASFRTSFSLRPWQGPLHLVSSVERVLRRGQLVDRVAESRETLVSISAAMSF